MAHISELPLRDRLFLKAYRYRRVDPVPWTPLRKPLSRCRVALISSAGFVTPGQEPFDDAVRGGDWSFREIPSDADPRSLLETHRSESFSHEGIRRDPNLAFPIDRMRELEKDGRIGSLNHRCFSFMGGLTAVGRFQRDSAPEMARRLAADGVDAALLVPV